MPLETPRLILRPWRLSDARFLFRYASHPAVGPVAGWAAHKSVLESRQVIVRHLSGPETYAVVLKSAGHPVGCVGLLLGEKSNLALPDGEAELGYWLGVPFWGRGLIPEAADALVRRAFDDLRLRKIWCGHYDGNANSRRVQEKCGFRFHHIIPHAPTAIKGDFRVEHVSCLTAQEWKSNLQEPDDVRDSGNGYPGFPAK